MRKIFELFIYAKYVSHILEIGEYEFVDMLIDNIDETKWDEYDKYFSMDLESINKQTGIIYVFKGVVELCLTTHQSDKLLYQIYDDYLYIALSDTLPIS